MPQGGSGMSSGGGKPIKRDVGVVPRDLCQTSLNELGEVRAFAEHVVAFEYTVQVERLGYPNRYGVGEVPLSHEPGYRIARHDRVVLTDVWRRRVQSLPSRRHVAPPPGVW